MGDLLFDHIQHLQGSRPWGAVLDAGTGPHSLAWIRGLPTTRWTAVTGDPDMVASVEEGAEKRRPLDRVVLGNWTDEALLAGETFDVVVADYLLGAVDGFAPYFQDRLFERLKRHVGGRLYVVGLEPLPDHAETEDAVLVTDIARLRDATLLLCRERCYREYPSTWVRRHLERVGFRVLSEERFGNVLGKRWIDGQIDMCLRRLARLPDPALAAPWRAYAEGLRRRAHARVEARGGLRCGHDHVVAAELAAP